MKTKTQDHANFMQFLEKRDSLNARMFLPDFTLAETETSIKTPSYHCIFDTHQIVDSGKHIGTEARHVEWFKFYMEEEMYQIHIYDLKDSDALCELRSRWQSLRGFGKKVRSVYLGEWNVATRHSNDVNYLHVLHAAEKWDCCNFTIGDREER